MNSVSEQAPTIFIVDDEFVLRNALSLVVRTMNFSVKCFPSAVEFIEYLETNQISGPVCLITDVQMPGMNGIELLEQLITLDKQIPVIITTGHGDQALKHKAENLGATFLEKPFRPADLLSAISTILNKAPVR